MKKILLSALALMMVSLSFAQQPQIQGDTMLCPEGNGTAYVANDMAYDSYQWYVDFYPHDTFVAVTGATESSFTYDAYNYSVAKIKVVTTVGANTYHSNELLIDSMVFLPIFYSTETEGNAYFDGNTGQYVICGGSDAVVNMIGGPYGNVQWFKDGAPIPGATQQQYAITTPGTYYAVASPQGCPELQETTLECVVVWCASNQGPVIAGDVMLCPDTNGTAGTITNNAYDTYQWYADFYPYGEFEAINGATDESFTYDWETYDQAKLKLVVTLGGETLESNIIQIDSYQWASMTIAATVTEEVSFNDIDQVWELCEGGGFTNTVNSPYTENIQWYKDGIAIDGATQSSYTITAAGSYTVTAGPEVCPDNTATSLPIIVEMKECNLGSENPQTSQFAIYPNPATSIITIANAEAHSSYAIYDVTGKKIISGTINNNNPVIAVDALEAGTYLLQLTGEQTRASQLFIKL